jgi:uncharacterized surface protein with fasciclin (FAS1) repeats
MKRLLLTPVLLAALIGLARPTPSPASDSASIYQTLATMKDHMILSVAVAEANEVAVLRAEGSVTLFAPTDAAFKKLDDATIKKVATDKDTVKKLFQSHLVNGKLTEEDLKKLDGKEIRTLQGTALKIEDGKDGLRVNGAKVVTSIPCSNGVIHVIDAVLPMPKAK